MSPRNRYVAGELNKVKLATLLFDLLTLEEEETDMLTGEFRFNIEFLAQRLIAATKWAQNNDDTKKLGLGYFGASTGAAARPGRTIFIFCKGDCALDCRVKRFRGD